MTQYVAKFSVGDRVKTVSPKSWYHDKTGTIVRVNVDGNALEYYIHLDNPDITYLCMNEDCLEKIEDDKKSNIYAEKQFMDVKTAYDNFVDILHLDGTQEKAFNQFMKCLLKYITVGMKPGLDYINHNTLAYNRVMDYLKSCDEVNEDDKS